MNWLTIARFWRAILIDEARVELERGLIANSMESKDERIVRALKLIEMARRQSRLSSLNCLKDFRSLFRERSLTDAIAAVKNSEETSSTGKSNVL